VRSRTTVSCWTRLDRWCWAGWTGSAERFADYSQWEAWQRAQFSNRTLKSADDGRRPRAESGESPAAMARKKLSYQEARELAAMERKIGDANKNPCQARGARGSRSYGRRSVCRTLARNWTQRRSGRRFVCARWGELEKKLSWVHVFLAAEVAPSRYLLSRLFSGPRHRRGLFCLASFASGLRRCA